MAFSLQDAYDGASDGAVITIPPGDLVQDDAARGASTIFGQKGSGAKRVTFVGGPGVVHKARVLTVHADNVTLKGAGWWVHFLMVGEPGDTSRGPLNVVLEDVHMDGLEIVGSQATLRRCQMGPCLLGYAPGTTGNGNNGGPITSTMWLDSNSQDPFYGAVERFWAVNGGSDNVPDPYFHNNSGGVRAKALLEDCTITGFQSLDPFNLHTGGGIIWNPPGDPLDTFVFRRCLFEKLGIQGLQPQETDGVTIEDCIFRGVYEPFGNVGKYVWQLAPQQKELILHKSSGMLQRIRLRRNKFCRGIRPSGSYTSSDVLIENNDLGTASATIPGATYINNTNAGAGCSGTTPPPDPEPPTGMNLRKKSETSSKITLEWNKVEGAIGYRFQSAALAPKWSHTWDANRTEVTFAKDQGPYTVQALGIEDEDSYP